MPKPVRPQLTDYAVTAISPILIMTMVGSLVFFLIEVLYDGQYSDRLLYTMTFFVIGTVLIARIMILHGANRALLYIAGLAAATFLALQAFVDYPNLTMRSFSAFINAALMALVWWSANKLTWDCTHIDEDRKNAGRGVLDAALDDTVEVPEEEKKKKKDSPGAMGWFDRWQRHRKKRLAKPHTPGVWVLYFSLASLPLFGLGQSLIPPGDAERRRSAFNFMVVYVGSGLGLLATTTLLGLRKYLRDRGATIPPKMTAGWLGLAAAIVVVFLLVASILPRPHSETPLVNLPKWASSKEKKASKNAQVKDQSSGEGRGARGKKTEEDQNADATKDGEKGAGNRDDKNAESGKKGNEENKSGGESKSEKKNESVAKNEEKKSEQSGGERKEEGRESESNESAETQSSSGSQRLGSVLETAGSFLKWLAWIIVALLVLGAIAIFFLRYLAPFTSWAKNLLDWLSSLFKKKSREKAASETDAKPEPEKPRPPPFDSFENPFAGGRKMKVEELVSYSFEAFESWAWERGCPREPNETPFEFARRVESETGFDGNPLVKLYGQLVYSQYQLPGTAAATVREFWKFEPRNG